MIPEILALIVVASDLNCIAAPLVFSNIKEFPAVDFICIPPVIDVEGVSVPTPTLAEKYVLLLDSIRIASVPKTPVFVL